MYGPMGSLVSSVLKGRFLMVAQTAVVEKSLTKQQPITRVRKWNKVTGRYEWAVVTQQQVEGDKLRAAYVAAFDPCNVGGW